MSKNKVKDIIGGQASHRRTESNYISTLLDTVSLEDWQDVIDATLQAAKAGDATARAWLAHYLMGKPQHNAPSPLTVVVQQWSGEDPVAKELAGPLDDNFVLEWDHDKIASHKKLQALITSELERILGQ